MIYYNDDHNIRFGLANICDVEELIEQLNMNSKEACENESDYETKDGDPR